MTIKTSGFAKSLRFSDSTYYVGDKITLRDDCNTYNEYRLVVIRIEDLGTNMVQYTLSWLLDDASAPRLQSYTYGGQYYFIEWEG